MKKISKVLTGGVAALATCALAFSLAACGGSSSSTSSSSSSSSSDNSSSEASLNLVNDGKLTVAAELGFAPFEYIDTNTNQPTGFDVDMATALAQKMGLEVNYLPNQKFDTLVPTIKEGGKADVAIAGITITDEREEEVDFSDPYLDSNQALVVKSSSSDDDTTLNDSSKKVACQAGTTGEEWIKENLPNAQLVALDDVTAAMTGVETGLYDGFVIDLPVADNQLKESFTDLKVAKEIPTGEQYGIVVSKDNPALKEAINKALQEMKDDGTMDQIETKWFGTTL
ncbi:MAG: ABC transporter substrate-binding protein [Coriobacteriales bacterium]|nr:ABC transporter substrate-binding protein [Coriobacteriales bacterium]